MIPSGSRLLKIGLDYSEVCGKVGKVDVKQF